MFIISRLIFISREFERTSSGVRAKERNIAIRSGSKKEAAARKLVFSAGWQMQKIPWRQVITKDTPLSLEVGSRIVRGKHESHRGNSLLGNSFKQYIRVRYIESRLLLNVVAILDLRSLVIFRLRMFMYLQEIFKYIYIYNQMFNAHRLKNEYFFWTSIITS